jgi:hypothetical protein
VVQFYRVRRAFRACATLGTTHRTCERARYNTSRRSLQPGGILTMEDGRHMVLQTEDDERAKAERLLRRLEEKDLKRT